MVEAVRFLGEDNWEYVTKWLTEKRYPFTYVANTDTTKSFITLPVLVHVDLNYTINGFAGSQTCCRVADLKACYGDWIVSLPNEPIEVWTEVSFMDEAYEE